MTFLVAVIAGLTAIYCLTIASFAWQDIAAGTVLATVLVVIFRRILLFGSLPEGGHVIHIIVYMPVLLWMLLVDVVKGTWQVAKYVIGIEQLHHPGIVRIPLGQHGRAGVGIVALLLTISPGSFLIDIDWEDSSMLVHYIDASDPARLRRDIEKYYRIWEYRSPVFPDPDPPDATADGRV